MSKGLFRGTFRARIDVKKGVSMMFLMRDIAGKYDATNAAQALPVWLEAAKKAGVELDRWSFYLPEVNQKLAKEAQTLPVSVVEKALKAGHEVYVTAGGFGAPKVVIAPPITTTKVKKSAGIEL